jgi:hypothetical protein
MAKIYPIGTRLEPEEADALKRAAVADDRPVTALMRRIIAEWLRTNGWLDPPAAVPPKAPSKARPAHKAPK